MKIYHNPRCRKSREALAILEENGVKPEIVEYLKEVPTEQELEDVLTKLNMKPEQLLRKGEEVYKKNFKGKTFNDHEWIKIMTEHPKLIERPIVISGYKAVVGRPPENVLTLID